MEKNINNDKISPQNARKELIIRSALESLIFASPEPLSIKKAHSILSIKYKDITINTVKEAFKRLYEFYNDSNRSFARGLFLSKTAGGFTFLTHPDYGELVRILFEEKPQKLTSAQLETLAIIAYRQPTTRIAIEEIRGVDTGSAIRKLLSIKLIKILGKSEAIGRPMLYGTTKYFLQFFNINSLHDLPSLNEYQELDKDNLLNTAKNNDDKLIIQDLFKNPESQMFSEATALAGEKALQNLDNALLNLQDSKINIEANNEDSSKIK